MTKNCFNSRIKLIVERMGVRQITDNTTISRSQIHHLKNTGETTGKNIRDIAEAANVNPLWLLTGEGPMMKGDPEPTQSPPPEFTNDEIEMIELFRKAPLMLKMKTIQLLTIVADNTPDDDD